MDAPLHRDPPRNLQHHTVRDDRGGDDAQLRLLEPAAPTWRLDDRTRQVGRRGVAAAREALRSARSHHPDPDDQTQRHAA